ncbi:MULTISPECIES: hypothetical protein [unclassified Bradyrhizobium]|uniref:hypothetical protein n=1 Tax=unclassified Bradyrhizobium TaxID=2631580 RepID=UPI002FF0734D
MPVLPNSQGRRGGSTANRWYETFKNIKCGPSSGVLQLSFNIGGNNNGITQIEVDIDPNDFADLVDMMYSANAHATVAVMSAKIAQHISREPTRNEGVVRWARGELSDLAHRKALDAWSNDEADKFAASVDALIQELAEKEKAEAEE